MPFDKHCSGRAKQIQSGAERPWQYWRHNDCVVVTEHKLRVYAGQAFKDPVQQAAHTGASGNKVIVSVRPVHPSHNHEKEEDLRESERLELAWIQRLFPAAMWGSEICLGNP